jgi:SAM-dependent methyltransferase
VDAELSNRIGEADERFVPGETPGGLMEAEHLARYLWATALVAGRRVLDAGCGVGYGTAMLANAGAAEAVGVDISRRAVEVAAAAAPANAHFLVGDVHELPFDDRGFDVVICFEVIEHVQDQDDVIAELARVLAPDGVLAISSPNRGVYPSGNPHHIHEYTHDELRRALGRVFAHVELHRQHDWVASAVLEDAGAGADALSDLHGVAVGKVVAMPPGSETYTVAVASREPLSSPPGRALLGGVDEIREWLRLAPLLEACTDERDRARRDVATLAAENTMLQERSERVWRELHGVYGSPSWRITRPLRALARLLERLRGRH